MKSSEMKRRGMNNKDVQIRYVGIKEEKTTQYIVASSQLGTVP